jgi:hypothetical protein
VFSYVVNYGALEGALRDGHIHLGAAGTNGPVVHFLDNIDSFKGSFSGTIAGNWASTELRAGLAPATVYNNFVAENYYFNIHSEKFRGGEIRGQIVAVPEPATMLGLATAAGLGAIIRRKQQKP